MKPRDWAMVVAVLGALGVVGFGAMVWRLTSIESADAADAERQFTEACASLPATAPLVTRDSEGRLVRRATTETATDRVLQAQIQSLNQLPPERRYTPRATESRGRAPCER